jgi:hypothetical protein
MTFEKHLGYCRRRSLIEHLEKEHGVNTIKAFVVGPLDESFSSRTHRVFLAKPVMISNNRFRALQMKTFKMRLSWE